MATPVGIEPTTVRLEGGCSIQLSYGALRSPKQTGLNQADLSSGGMYLKLSV